MEILKWGLPRHVVGTVVGLALLLCVDSAGVFAHAADGAIGHGARSYCYRSGIPSDCDSIPGAAKASLFKKLTEFFKFRANALNKEKIRVTGITRPLIKDSLLRTKGYIDSLIGKLSLKQNQNLDSLVAVIKQVNSRVDAVSRNMGSGTGKDTLTTNDSGSSGVTDDQIRDLANKLLPLIAEKTKEDAEAKNKREYLNSLSGVDPDKLYTDTAGANIRVLRRVIRNRCSIYGFYDRNSKLGDSYGFDHIDTLIYNALGIDGKTGAIIQRGNWDTAGVIDRAKSAHCGIVVSFLMQGKDGIPFFLNHAPARRNFLNSVVPLLQSGKVDGINIDFGDLQPENGSDFLDFIQELRNRDKFRDSTYRLFITIPAVDRYGSYDLVELNKLADKFLIKFTGDGALPSKIAGALFPLAGRREGSIESCVSRIRNAGLSGRKLILDVPYFGTEWTVEDNKAPDHFLRFIHYDQLRKHYDWPVYYDEESASAIMDSSVANGSQSFTYRVWFDDENSLDKKYAYVIQSGLNGVAIDALGYDDGYGELKDELAYKFARIDTLTVRSRMLPGDLGFFDRLYRRWYLYNYILQNPCERCFDNIEDSATYAEVSRCLVELKTDSFILAANMDRSAEDQFKSRFQYINSRMTRSLGWVTLTLALLSLIIGIIYNYLLRGLGDDWKYKKPVGYLLIAMIFLLGIGLFSFLFSNHSFPLFGLSYGQDNAKVPTRKKVLENNFKRISPIEDPSVQFLTDSTLCVQGPGRRNCINMPLYTLLSIVIFVFIIGFLLTKWLAFPLMKKGVDDIP